MSDEPEDLERYERIMDLAKTLLRAGEAMDREEWALVQKLAAECARMSRVLAMLDRKKQDS